jgi:hypothetical protein
LAIEQGDIFSVDGSPWIVIDAAHDRFGGSETVHCAPVLSSPELRLDLDVQIGDEPAASPASQMGIGIPSLGVHGYVSLLLICRHARSRLQQLVARASRLQVEEIRRNLVTWFSVFSFDFDTVRRLPPPPDEPPAVYPGMIFSTKGETVCVVDHWGCFNEYPLLYVAPVQPTIPRPTPLDVDISADYRDLFSNQYFVRTNEFYQVERNSLNIEPKRLVPTLSYGLIRKISRAYALKFGQLSLLL